MAELKIITPPQRDTATQPGCLVQFAFVIGQRVVIRGSNIEADVVGLMRDQEGERYQIVWWYSGSRQDAWVFPREIIAKGACDRVAGSAP